MRIAVIADIHGDSFALEAVLEDVSRQHVDEIVVAGDLVNLLPGARETWQILKSLDCRLLQGNHEYYVYTVGNPGLPPIWQSERFLPSRWTAQQFSEAEKAEMKALPWHYSQPGLLITHASERSLFDSVWPETTDEALETFFPTTEASLVVRGHNHGWFERQWNARKIVTVNSCGQPLGGDIDAPYAVLTADGAGGWLLDKRAVRYDHAAAMSAMNEEYIENVGALGLIFRLELQTAEHHLGPFFDTYGNALDAEEISLRAAVERYLSGV